MIQVNYLNGIKKFTVDSHHLNEDIINISHRIRTGSIMVRSSYDWIILTCIPKFDLVDICKSIKADSKKVSKYLYDSKGIVKDKNGTVRFFNTVCIKMNTCVDINGDDTPRYFTLNDIGSSKTMKALDFLDFYLNIIISKNYI